MFYCAALQKVLLENVNNHIASVARKISILWLFYILSSKSYDYTYEIY